MPTGDWPQWSLYDGLKHPFAPYLNVTIDKPPIGIDPKIVWLEKRRDDLYEAINRYKRASLDPNIEWLEELIKLEIKIKRERTSHVEQNKSIMASG
jgi:hypothetical protein